MSASGNWTVRAEDRGNVADASLARRDGNDEMRLRLTPIDADQLGLSDHVGLHRLERLLPGSASV